MTQEELAIFFHNTYERLAPSFGYETRKDTKQFDADSANGKLMIAVCGEILNSLQQPIPQDINKLSDPNSEKHRRKMFESTVPQDINKFVKDGAKSWEANNFGKWKTPTECFIAGAQLLLPELQQLRDKTWALEGVVKHQESEIEELKEQFAKETGAAKINFQQYQFEIEQQKETIEELKRNNSILEERYTALNNFVNNTPVKQKMDEQAAEIASLKQENERFVKERDEQKAANKYPKPSGYDEFGAMYDDSPY